MLVIIYHNTQCHIPEDQVPPTFSYVSRKICNTTNMCSMLQHPNKAKCRSPTSGAAKLTGSAYRWCTSCFSEVLELQTDMQLDTLSTQWISYIWFSCKFFTNGGKFLSSCTIDGFSRRVQLHGWRWWVNSFVKGGLNVIYFCKAH
jgi:hypothetical protein